MSWRDFLGFLETEKANPVLGTLSLGDNLKLPLECRNIS